MLCQGFTSPLILSNVAPKRDDATVPVALCRHGLDPPPGPGQPALKPAIHPPPHPTPPAFHHPPFTTTPTVSYACHFPLRIPHPVPVPAFVMQPPPSPS